MNFMILLTEKLDMTGLYNSNRRKTSRFIMEVKAKLLIFDDDSVLIEKDIEILNISMEGIKIFFQDNELMNMYLDTKKSSGRKIKIDFTFEEVHYSFYFSIKWVKIIDNAEKNLILWSGLCFSEDSTETKEKKLDILVSLHMNHLYLGNVS
jgi:hypothetical protein